MKIQPKQLVEVGFRFVLIASLVLGPINSWTTQTACSCQATLQAGGVNSCCCSARYSAARKGVCCSNKPGTDQVGCRSCKKTAVTLNCCMGIQHRSVFTRAWGIAKAQANQRENNEDSLLVVHEVECDCGCRSEVPEESLPAVMPRAEQTNEKVSIAAEQWSNLFSLQFELQLYHWIEPAPPDAAVLSSIERCARICRWQI